MAGNESPSPIEISGDDDWKSRVKAEDAALDQKLAAGEKESVEGAEQGTAESHPSTEERPRASAGRARQLPEATFGALVGLLSTQAMVALGAIPNPVTGKPEPEMETARYFVDLLGELDQKTAGNLSPEEARSLEEVLHSLRMAYIELSKAS